MTRGDRERFEVVSPPGDRLRRLCYAATPTAAERAAARWDARFTRAGKFFGRCLIRDRWTGTAWRVAR